MSNGVKPAISLRVSIEAVKHAVEGDQVVTREFFDPTFAYANLSDEDFQAIEMELIALQGRLLAMKQGA